MNFFSPLATCVVYICIVFQSVSISQARDIRSTGYGSIESQIPYKGQETTKTIVPSGDNANTLMACSEEAKKIRAHEIEGIRIPLSSNPKGKAKRKLSQTMVTWRVPRTEKKKKTVVQQQQQQQQQRQQPLFDLDYAPPKVHPPTHN